MFLENLKVTNFKSFDEIDIPLGKFNTVIGSNASGKSNFVNVFKFLRDIANFGLDNAISMQGGVDFVRNVNIGASKDLSVELRFTMEERPFAFPIEVRRGEKKQKYEVGIGGFLFKFAIRFHKRTKGYTVKEEILEATIHVREVKTNERESKEKRKTKDGIAILRRDEKGEIKSVLKTTDIPKEIEGALFPRIDLFFPKKPVKKAMSREVLLLSGSFISPISYLIHAFFRDLGTYDIDPKLPKKSSLITGKTELESDASNLAIVLRNILKSRKHRERLFNILKDLLPFVEGLSVEKMADRSLIACLRETYSGRRFLPASLISDGTINLTAMVIALYFEVRPLIIIEEPEKNLHPYLVSKLVDMMKDVSENREMQIIVTTHNPEMVKYSGIENIFLIHREDGFSEISKPYEKEEVKHFLKDKMGIEELYVQNMLEW